MAQYIDTSAFDTNLRLGDIIKGFSHIMPTFDDFFFKGNQFRLEVVEQPFFVVLTPCCSIEDKIISLLPLKPIKSSFLTNPAIIDDITILNRPMSAQNAIPPIGWQKLPEEERTLKLQQPPNYYYLELFGYGPHPLLPQYDLSYRNQTQKMSSFMVDFKESFTITSKKIERNNSYEKVLQLSIASRGELRNKISNFYSRVPDEDIVIE